MASFRVLGPRKGHRAVVQWLLCAAFLLMIYLHANNVHKATTLKSTQQGLIIQLLGHLRKFKIDSKIDKTTQTKAYNDTSVENGKVLSGYLRSQKGVCLLANVKFTQIFARDCSLNVDGSELVRMHFTWTPDGHVTVNKKCLSRDENRVFLDVCYDNFAGQIWSEPTEDQFILHAETGICLKLNPEKKNRMYQVEANDCWNSCALYNFSLATWFVVQNPDQKPDETLLKSLAVKEKQPWQTRYCLDVKTLYQENSNKLKEYEQTIANSLKNNNFNMIL